MNDSQKNNPVQQLADDLTDSIGDTLKEHGLIPPNLLLAVSLDGYVLCIRGYGMKKGTTAGMLFETELRSEAELLATEGDDT